MATIVILALAITLALGMLLVPAIGTIVFAQNMTGGMGGNVSEKMGGMAGNLTEKAGNVSEKMGGMAGNLTEKAGNLTEKAGSMIGNITG